jgi:hypothetical protein
LRELSRGIVLDVGRVSELRLVRCWDVLVGHGIVVKRMRDLLQRKVSTGHGLVWMHELPSRVLLGHYRLLDLFRMHELPCRNVLKLRLICMLELPCRNVLSRKQLNRLFLVSDGVLLGIFWLIKLPELCCGNFRCHNRECNVCCMQSGQ